MVSGEERLTVGMGGGRGVEGGRQSDVTTKHKRGKHDKVQVRSENKTRQCKDKGWRGRGTREGNTEKGTTVQQE